MAVRIYKPTSAGRRKSSVQDFSDITKYRPTKSLVETLQRHSGRNNTGKITVRHQGGGVKRLYRKVDFVQKRFDIPAKVEAIEYDPNRGPRIALIRYEDGELSYILAPKGLVVGNTVLSTKQKKDAAVGMRMPIVQIPVGMFVHNVEFQPGQGGQLARGAGSSVQIQTIEGEYAQLKMPSGEVRMVKKECMASVGIVGNEDYHLVRYGKAGRMRHRGIRPTVRGKVMNPVDHPHGGGEGRNSIGLRGGPKTMWGKKARGVKTRKPSKWSNTMIVSRRHKKK